MNTTDPKSTLRLSSDWKIALISAALLVLSGCGGDEGSNSEGSNSEESSNEDSASEGGNNGCSAEQESLNEAMEEALNDARTSDRVCHHTGNHFPAVGSVSSNDQLMQAAHGHSRDMADNDHWSHVGTDGLSAGDRASNAGYDWSRIGENIARASFDETAAEVVQRWLDSDSGHCETVMDASYDDFGASCAISDGGDRYWTLKLASQ